MALCSYGLSGYGLYRYGLSGYGLHGNGIYSPGLYSYGLCSRVLRHVYRHVLRHVHRHMCVYTFASTHAKECPDVQQCPVASQFWLISYGILVMARVWTLCTVVASQFWHVSYGISVTACVWTLCTVVASQFCRSWNRGSDEQSRFDVAYLFLDARAGTDMHCRRASGRVRVSRTQRSCRHSVAVPIVGVGGSGSRRPELVVGKRYVATFHYW